MEMITPALKIWRDAVLTAQSAAQLSMCLSMLYDCVAWEKSIMKVVSVKRGVFFFHGDSTVGKGRRKSECPEQESILRYHHRIELYVNQTDMYQTFSYCCLSLKTVIQWLGNLLLSYLVTYSNSDVLCETCGSKAVKQNYKPVELSISARQIRHFSP